MYKYVFEVVESGLGVIPSGQGQGHLKAIFTKNNLSGENFLYLYVFEVAGYESGLRLIPSGPGQGHIYENSLKWRELIYL